MNLKDIVFWQNIPSILQAPLISKLAEIGQYNVTLVTESDVYSKRKDQGWERPNFEPANLIIEPEEEEIEEVWSNTGNVDSIHIFTGIDGFPMVYENFKRAVKTPVKVGIFSEPGRYNDKVAWLRRLKYRWLALRWNQEIDFILPTGQLAIDWYKGSGFSKPNYFPFGYFVKNEEPDEALNIDKSEESIVQFIFIGQLIRRKGIDCVFRALSLIKSKNWELTIIGDGRLSGKFKKQAEDLGIKNRITFKGVVPNNKVFKYLSCSDYLILPSRFDGWGAVVNEALTVGTKCIVSDNCGSSDLINSELQGFVFPSGDVSSLKEKLEHIVKNTKKVSKEEREDLSGWAKKNISPHMAAKYLLNILEYEVANQQTIKMPTVPWREN